MDFCIAEISRRSLAFSAITCSRVLGLRPAFPLGASFSAGGMSTASGLPARVFTWSSIMVLLRRWQLQGPGSDPDVVGLLGHDTVLLVPPFMRGLVPAFLATEDAHLGLGA